MCTDGMKAVGIEESKEGNGTKGDGKRQEKAGNGGRDTGNRLTPSACCGTGKE
jgi:hypothetical protein